MNAARAGRGRTEAARVLEFMSQPSYRPMRPNALASQLAVNKKRFRSLIKSLQALLAGGQIRLDARGRLLLSAAHSQPSPNGAPHLEPPHAGIVQVRPGGFAFLLVPDGEDLFIPPGELAGALDGDRVAVQPIRGRRRGPAVRVVEIIERARSSVSGIYYELAARGGGRPGGYVLSEHPALADGIEIPAGATAGARMGDKVKVNIVAWPCGNRPATGGIAAVFGQAGDWQAELAAVIDNHALRVTFPPAAMAEADALAADSVAREAAHRHDFRSLLTVTIDPEDAQDFDDAVSVQKHGDGWRLYVHIADVAYFVAAGGAIDAEARLRGTSVYLPGQVLPMLPPTLTRYICCLREAEDRLALTVRLDFDSHGRRQAYSIHKAVIRSDMRLTYEQVREALDGQMAGLPGRRRDMLPADIHDALVDMRTLAGLLRKERLAAGAIDLDMPEPHLLFDGDGRVCEIRLRRSHFAYQMIEDFMLAANRAVAEYLARWNLPGIFRKHDEPAAGDLRRLSEALEHYGMRFAAPFSRQKIQKILDDCRDKPYVDAVQMLVLRSMARAMYAPLPLPHYALAFRHYLHFTSPIRRYPDLWVHRLLHAAMGAGNAELLEESRPAGRPPHDAADLGHLAAHCSERERAAEEAEETLTRYRQIEYLRRRLEQTYAGVVVNVGKYGLVVELQSVWLSGVLGIEEMRRAGYRYQRARRIFTSRSGRRIRLGDRLKVRVQCADLASGAVDLRMAE